MKSINIVLKNAEISLFLYENITYQNLKITPPHLHPLPELFIILNGSAKLSGDFGSIKVTEQEICLIPPLIYHSIINDSSYTRLAISFIIRELKDAQTDIDIYRLFIELLSSGKPFTTTFNPKLISDIHNCLIKNEPLTDEKLKGILSLIFIEVAEKMITSPVLCKRCVNFSKKNEYYSWLAENDYVIYSYASGKITVEDLSAEMYLTCRQISRIISAEYKMNLKELRRHTRMKQSLFYLQHTEMSISDISKTLGFSSTESFYIVFKNYYGVSPSALRKNASNL